MIGSGLGKSEVGSTGTGSMGTEAAGVQSLGALDAGYVHGVWRVWALQDWVVCDRDGRA